MKGNEDWIWTGSREDGWRWSGEGTGIALRPTRRGRCDGVRAPEFAADSTEGDISTTVDLAPAVSGLPIIPSYGRRIFPTHLRQGANDGSGSLIGRRAGGGLDLHVARPSVLGAGAALVWCVGARCAVGGSGRLGCHQRSQPPFGREDAVEAD